MYREHLFPHLTTDAVTCVDCVCLQAVVEALSSYSRLSQLEKLRDRFEYKDPAGEERQLAESSGSSVSNSLNVSQQQTRPRTADEAPRMRAVRESCRALVASVKGIL